MKRREFVRNTLTAAGALLPLYACNSGGNAAGKKIKVVVIGVDGANWQTMDPLMAEGKLPFWKQLKGESAWANLKTFRPTKSSVVWTSIATGKSMQKHGIYDFTFMDKNNIKVPFTNVERREPAIWQILDDVGKKAIVVNWFVSHPPDKINGIMISDNFRRVVARPVEKVEEYRNSVHPSIYFHKLLKLAERDFDKISQIHGIPDYTKLYGELHPGEDFRKVPILKTFRSMARQDNFISSISKELFRTKDFDMFATYIRMPDLVQHFSARMFDDTYTKKLVAALQSGSLSDEQRQEAILKIGHIIEPAYRFAEDLIKSLMTYKKYEDAYFLIMSDHGFSLYPGGYNHYDLPEGMEPPDGILLMKGPGVRTGFIDEASVFDIAPTILNIFDLPVGKNMDGKPLRKALKLNRRVKYKTYKLDPKDKKKRPNKVDDATMEELKSLGYVK